MSAECHDKDRRVESIIQKLMDRLQFDQESLCGVRTNNKSKHLIDIHGVGSFHCDECCRSWISAFSWITVDLKSGKVKKWWYMKCYKCGSEHEPTFDEQNLETMITRAIERYQGKPSGGYQGTNRSLTKPHNNLLCEKCGYCNHQFCYAFMFRQVQYFPY